MSVAVVCRLLLPSLFNRVAMSWVGKMSFVLTRSRQPSIAHPLLLSELTARPRGLPTDVGNK